MIRLSILLIFLVACEGTKSTVTPDVFGNANYINEFISKRKKLASHSNAAQKVSLFDTTTGDELSSVQKSGAFQQTFFIGEKDTIAAVGAKEVFVTENGESLSLEIPEWKSTGRWAAALKAGAFAFVRDDGSGIHLLRNLGGGQWQNESFALPKTDMTPVVVLSPDGLLLSIIDTKTGSNYTFTANSKTEKISGPKRSCTFTDSISSLTSPIGSISAISYWEEKSVALLGTEKGKLYAFNPATAAPCTVISAMPSIELQSEQIVRLSPTADTLWTTQRQGAFHSIQFDGTIFTKTSTGSITNCEYPLGIIPFQSYLSFFCGKQTGKDWSLSFKSSSLSGSGVIDVFSDYKTESLNSFTIDKDSNVLIVHYESGLGELRLFNTLTGAMSVKKGQNTKGILD